MDQAGKATQYEWNGRSSLKAVTNALHQRTSYSYDVDGKPNIAQLGVGNRVVKDATAEQGGAWLWAAGGKDYGRAEIAG